MKTNRTILWLAVIATTTTTMFAQKDTSINSGVIELQTSNSAAPVAASAPVVVATLVTNTMLQPQIETPTRVVPVIETNAPADAPATVPAPAPADTNAPATTPKATNDAPETVVTPPASIPTIAAEPARNMPSATLKPGELLLNFRGAPLESVLHYLSDAAGFIIVLDTTVRGKVDVWSSQPVTKDEAVKILNSVLNKNGYAVIRDDRTLTIVDKNDAKNRDIPVKVGSDPDGIPKNDEIVTQIIPIRYIEAEALIKDLASFIPSSATVVANAAANSLVITDTQANIHHLTKIIRAIDNSAEGETQIRVFQLKHANPTDVASLLSGVFPSSASSSGNQTPIRFGGPGGFRSFFGGGRGDGGGQQGGGSQNQRIQKQTQVVAVADPRTSSVVVTASKDLMEQIAQMVGQIDVRSTRDQQVYVFQMKNGDPQQAVQVLQNMFQSSTFARGTSASQNSALMQRQQNNASSSSSTVSGSSTSTGFGTSSSPRGGGGGQLF